MDNKIPPPPPGFTIDQSAIPPPPPGFTIDGDGGGFASNAWSSFKGAIAPIVGAAEAGTQFVTGALAAPIAGFFGGIGSYGTRAAGITNSEPADVVRGWQDAMTYQPRTAAGEVASSILNYPFAKLAQGADWAGQKVSDATGSPAAGAATNAAVQFAPALLFKAGQSAVSRVRGAPATPPPPTPEAAAKAYVSSRTSLDWGAIPSRVQATLTEIAKDARSLERLDPAAVERQVRLESFSTPVPGTRGQLTRDPVQLANERLAADTEAGKPVRDVYVQQNRALLDNLEVLTQKQRGKAGSPEEAGRAIQDAARANLEAQKAKVSDLYKKADAAGETSQIVDVTPILDLIERVPDTTRYGWVQSWLNKTKVSRGASEVRDPITNQVTQEAKPAGMSIRNLERLRQDAQADLTSADGKARFYAGQLIDAIDQVTEGSGGKLYAAARAARKEQAMRFQEPRGVARLVEDRSRTDPATALEDTWRRTVIGGSIDDLRMVKRELLTNKKGVQAWREMRAQTAQHIVNEATKSVSRMEDGTPNITPASMDRAIKSIGQDKLQEILGPRSLAELNQIMEAVRLLKSDPPRSFQGSPTAPAMVRLLERWARKIPVLGDTATGLVRTAANLAEEGRAAQQVKAAQTTPLAEGQQATRNALMQKRTRNALARSAAAIPATQQNK